MTQTANRVKRQLLSIIGEMAAAPSLFAQNPTLYRFLPTNATFDFMNVNAEPYYPIDFRIVRFQITDNTYEAVITSLDRNAFPREKLKRLYNLRRGIEAAFAP